MRGVFFHTHARTYVRAMQLTGWKHDHVGHEMSEWRRYGLYTIYQLTAPWRRRELTISRESATETSWLWISRDTFIAFSYAQDRATAYTINAHKARHERLWVPCTGIGSYIRIIGLSICMPRRMRRQYNCDGEPVMFVGYANPEKRDYVTTAPLAGTMPMRPRGRNSAHMRVITGGHIQRCIYGIVAVGRDRDRIRRGIVRVHVGERVYIYRNVRCISVTSAGWVVINGYTELHMYGPDVTALISYNNSMLARRSVSRSRRSTLRRRAAPPYGVALLPRHLARRSARRLLRISLRRIDPSLAPSPHSLRTPANAYKTS